MSRSGSLSSLDGDAFAATQTVLLLDAGGVLISPASRSIAAALAPLGARPMDMDDPEPHYRSVAEFDRVGSMSAYRRTFALCLGVPTESLHEAELADIWTAPWTCRLPGVPEALDILLRRFDAVAIVSDSDGTVQAQLEQAAVCQVGEGRLPSVRAVFDSSIVGVTKPDPAIFRAALSHLDVQPDQAIHVGDSLRCDVVGAQQAGLMAVHIDPLGLCHDHGHRHTNSLLAYARSVGGPGEQSRARGVARGTTSRTRREILGYTPLGLAAGVPAMVRQVLAGDARSRGAGRW